MPILVLKEDTYYTSIVDQDLISCIIQLRTNLPFDKQVVLIKEL